MIRVALFLLLASPAVAQSAGGYAGYAPGGNSEGAPVEGAGSEGAVAPQAPMAPPRVPLAEMTSSGSALNYRPPPPPLRRDEKSIGQCSFDSSKWEIEPQSAIAHAIMFDRTTGLSCEECLEKCTQFQDASSQWVCRTLTYDNNWKICDLFAVNGTEHPYFLTQYDGRDYFVYLAALPPTDSDLNAVEKQESEAAATTAAPSGGKAPESADADADGAHTTLAEVNNEVEVEATAAPGAEPAAPAPSAAPEAPAAPASSVEVAAASNKQTDYQAVHSDSAPKSGVGRCASDEVTRYVQFESAERANPGEEVGFAAAKTREECAAACDREQISPCASAVYSPSGCELSASTANHSITGSLTSSSTAVYLEKTCLKTKLAQGTKLIFPAVTNYILVGHVQEVADANSLAECQAICLQSQQTYGFHCKSAMYYPSDEAQNCVLSHESRTTKPEVFVQEDQGVNMVYFEIAYDNIDFKSNDLNMRFRDSPLSDVKKDSKWTRWSDCTKNLDGMRYRYLKCTNKKDIRKCPKESTMCRHLPALNIQKIDKSAECRAVVDSLGRKRCPHGIRVTKNGRREYCTRPVDC